MEITFQGSRHPAQQRGDAPNDQNPTAPGTAGSHLDILADRAEQAKNEA